MRSFEHPGRSPVMAREAMAATSHPLATETALRILRSGGNALDAAIAACAMQCAVEPGSTGVGGDCFVLYAPADGSRIRAFNGSGRAPAAATVEWFAEQGIDRIEPHSPHAVTVPGVVDAWIRLNADHGCLGLDRLLQPAIDAARHGYPVAPRTRADWNDSRDLLAREAETRSAFLPDGRPPGVGDIHSQSRLAATLERIAAEGRDGFYSGPVADDMVACLRARGGLHTLDDFAAAAGDYVDPIRTDYHGHEVWECPPNGQGVIALLLLNLFRELPAAGGPLSVERIHLELEAAKLAYADRDALLADPAYADVPVSHLLGAGHAEHLRARIDPRRAGPPEPAIIAGSGRDTVYISVVDGDGNAASFIASLFNSFGSGLLAPRSGVLLHSRGQSFSLRPGHPNAIAPGKRPLHTIIPAIVTHNGRACMPFGVMGGHYQALGHAQFLSRVFDFGRDLQEAMDLPRFFAQPGTGRVEVEDRVSAAGVAGLRRRGHEVIPAARPIGGSQAIWMDHERGILVGASDPRKDGCALGY